jgi:D-alanyl-D-alanine carboxypeptidase
MTMWRSKPIGAGDLTRPAAPSTRRPRPKGPAALLLAVFALGLAAGPGQAVAADAAARQARLDTAFAAIQAALARSDTPGAVVAITDRERLLNVSAYGYADLKARIPLRTDARFPLGSISKSFTAIVLMQLSDEGRFDPAKPLSTYLPAFQLAAGATPLTGPEILSHTGGLPDYRADLASSPAVLEALKQYRPDAAPGQHFWYSNLGFQVLGYALEQVDDAPYRAVIARRLFAPLGMDHAVALIDDSQRDQTPVSYDRGADGVYRESTWFEYAAADGSVIASAADLGAYVRLLLNRGVGPKGRLLSEAAFTALTTPVTEHYGYGLRLKSDASGAVVWHGGSIMGFLDLFEAHLGAGYGVIILTNGGIDPALKSRILATLDAAWTGAAAPPAASAASAAEAPPPSAFVGAYHAAGGRTLTLTLNGPTLVARVNGQTLALRRAGPDMFTPPTQSALGYPLIFGLNGSGPVGVSVGADWYTPGATSAPAPTPDNFRALVGHYQNRSPEGPVTRVFVRDGALMLRMDGEVQAAGKLQHLPDGSYGLAAAPDSPERLRFGPMISGRTVAIDFSGAPLYRIDTP